MGRFQQRQTGYLPSLRTRSNQRLEIATKEQPFIGMFPR